MKYKFFALVSLIFLFTSCKKYLDINEDPNNPTTVASSLLLSSAERSIGDNLGFGYNAEFEIKITGASDVLSVYTHQSTQYSSNNKYEATGSDLSNMWTGVYVEVLQNLSALIKETSEEGDLLYAGIGTILQAYTFSQLVDIFGDVPFEEALSFKSEDIVNPHFDNGEDIYPQLFKMLDTGIIFLQDEDAENIHEPAGDDLIYGGDPELWIKAANTIKLKLYNQIRLVQNVQSEVTALLDEPLIESTDESFALPYGTKNAPEERNPGFLEYSATQRTVDVSPWFYEILKGANSNIFFGIKDPRMPYYIFNQLEADEPTVEGNTPEYRDGAFVSLIFGSDGPNYGSSQDNSQSVMGIYPVGGRFDDGNGAGGSGVSSSSGTGAAPFRMITYADRLFIEAELIKEGVLPGGDAAAQDKFEEALNEAFEQVDYFVGLTGAVGQSVPDLTGTDKVEDYISDIMDYYSAHPSQQLEIIMTQKWISAMGGNYVDLYSDHRRTGFPVFFDPNNSTMAPGGKVQPPVNGNPFVSPQPAVTVSISRGFPLTLPWSSSELDANQNAPKQKTDPSTYKVFWLP